MYIPNVIMTHLRAFATLGLTQIINVTGVLGLGLTQINVTGVLGPGLTQIRISTYI